MSFLLSLLGLGGFGGSGLVGIILGLVQAILSLVFFLV